MKKIFILPLILIGLACQGYDVKFSSYDNGTPQSVNFKFYEIQNTEAVIDINSSQHIEIHNNFSALQCQEGYMATTQSNVLKITIADSDFKFVLAIGGYHKDTTDYTFQGEINGLMSLEDSLGHGYYARNKNSALGREKDSTCEIQLEFNQSEISGNFSCENVSDGLNGQQNLILNGTFKCSSVQNRN